MHNKVTPGKSQNTPFFIYTSTQDLQIRGHIGANKFLPAEPNCVLGNEWGEDLHKLSRMTVKTLMNCHDVFAPGFPDSEPRTHICMRPSWCGEEWTTQALC